MADVITLPKSLYVRAVTFMARGRGDMSAGAIWGHMMGAAYDGGAARRAYPKSPPAFASCLRLLAQVPEWRPRLPEMAQYSPGWAGLVPAWDEIAALLTEEAGPDWADPYHAPRAYRAISVAIAQGYTADPRYDCALWPDGTLRRAHPRNPEEMRRG